MKNWIKENLVLAIGLTLPLLLIVLFFVASVLPKSMGTPPQYEMLFTTVKYEYESSPDYLLDFNVKNKALMVKAKKNDDKGKNFNSKRLMAYDGKTETVREIAIDASKFGDGVEMILDETKNFSIDISPTSPDGYALEGPNYGSSGLVGGLFGGGYRNNGYRIKKGSVAYKLVNTPVDYYYDQVKFIGWVITK
jgi:hypothetical protein